MMATKGKHKGKSCACGNPDQDKLATCSKCGAQEHIHCMLIPQREVPRVWQCGDCIAFRAAPSTSPHKVVATIQKDNSQNAKVKRINEEEASRLHGRSWCGLSTHNARLKVPPNKKPYAYKGSEFLSRLQKVSSEPANKVRTTSSPRPPSEFSNKKTYAYQRNELFTGSQKVSPEPPVKMRRNDSPPSWFSKPLHTGNNVYLPSDQTLKDGKDKCSEDPIVRRLEEEALVHEKGAELSNMIKEALVVEESPKPVVNDSDKCSEDLIVRQLAEEALVHEKGAELSNMIKEALVVEESPKPVVNGSDVLAQKPMEPVSKATPMEIDLLQEESKDSAWKAGQEVHGVSDEFQQLGNLVIPKCSPSTIKNPPPRTTSFPRLPSKFPTWTGKFIFSDPAITGDCDGMFEAYPPNMVDIVAYQYGGFFKEEELPVDLVPLSELSPYLPPHDSWDYQDIALYIIPDCTQSRSVQAYHRLIQVMLTQEVALKTCVLGDVELLIFTSKHLHLDDKRLSERVYLWAVFLEGTRTT